MLSPEEGWARLEAQRIAGWRDRADRRAGQLKRKLREPARAFLAPHPGFRSPDQAAAHKRSQLAAATTLDGLSAADLTAVMTALHPGLGPALAQWWVDARSQPYQRGWDRKAFRAPSSAAVTAAARGSDLGRLIQALGSWDADPVWLAGWAGHLTLDGKPLAPYAHQAGGLLAAAVDLGGRDGDATLTALLEVGSGEHPVGLMGRHVITALLRCARAEAWDFTERLLLAAQLQEGLRQAILEAADEGHPAAFDRILALVLDRKLLRFAASVRAAGVWLGFGADVAEIPLAEARVRTLAQLRADPAARAAALTGPDPWPAYIALCAQGMRDVLTTIPDMQQLARHPDPQLRAAALRYASATGLAAGQSVLVAALGDPDPRVAALAASGLISHGLQQPETFDALARLIPRLPARPRGEAIGVEQVPVTMSRADTARKLIDARGTRPVGALLPWLPAMDAPGRTRLAGLIAREEVVSAEIRAVVVQLAGDRSPAVRKTAIETLRKVRLAPAEATAIEGLLTRSAADLRRGAITVLATLPAGQAAQSADRLARSTDAGQRAAAAELARLLGIPVPAGAGDPAAAGPGAAATIAPVQDLRVTMVDPSARSRPQQPATVRRRGGYADGRARELVTALDEVAARHRNTPVRLTSWQGSQEMLFGDIRWFHGPFGGRGPAADETAGGMLLGEYFAQAWSSRPAAGQPGTDDALDALRAHVVAQVAAPSGRFGAGAAGAWWRESLLDLTGGQPQRLRFPAAVQHAALWLVAEHAATPAVITECLDALETTLAPVPATVLLEEPRAAGPGYGSYWDAVARDRDWRSRLAGLPWLTVLRGLLRTRPELFEPDQISRWFRLERWIEQPHPLAEPRMPQRELLVAAHACGAATDADVITAFLRPRDPLFRDLTSRRRGQLESSQPRLCALADEVRDRLIEVELTRGDLPTPTSGVVTGIRSAAGTDLVVRLLAQLGKSPLARGWNGGGGDSRDEVLSHLIRVSFPGPADSAPDLIAAARAARIADARLVDLAVYAPQWAPFAESALDWPGLASGVLWMHAHTKDSQWSVDAELRESWAAMTAERTPLTTQDLIDGAVDVAWFAAAYAALGAQRWAVLHKSARHASGGSGHRRAQVFADAMLGHATEEELTGRVAGSRNQDAVRALGLLPLPPAGPERDETVSRRYATLRDFERGSRKFGSQRQASERTAVRIGIDNLARSAGYADPRRFSWIVEAREAADLASGPVAVSRGEVTVTLSVGADGTPDLAVRKGTRKLAAVPAALRKDEQVAALRERKTALTRQAARVRAALEAAMIARDTFRAEDFAGLRRHPVVAPMLEQLVWVDEAGQTRLHPGSDASGGPLRIAHPADLAADGSWVAWQERLFTEERRQPFRQVFRELYALTAAERESSPVSRRYDGQQLQPRQAAALFGARGWLSSREDGTTSRVFHDHNLTAHVEFANGFLTAAEAELPSICGVYFTRRGERLAQPLGDVPAVVFSETMRDLDLVVSVAHAGGVDPEATASTTQMRAALVRESARLLKLGNVSFASEHHVLVSGQLGEYSVHLGSGTVHRRPGGAVCIIPVGSQHRGRLFLPFADDDPKTAEIMSKVLLLARDHEIRDPSILEQLRLPDPGAGGSVRLRA